MPITKLERRDVPPELLFTERQLPRAFPPRAWKDGGEEPEQDDGDAPEHDDEAQQWAALSPMERAAMLESDTPRAARMATANERAREVAP